jgi:hypothetical protein
VKIQQNSGGGLCVNLRLMSFSFALCGLLLAAHGFKKKTIIERVRE